MTKRLTLLVTILLFLGLLSAQSSIQDSYNLETNGNYAGALQIMQTLAGQEPSEPFYTIRIAWLQYLLGQYQAAISSYQTALQALDHLDAHTGLINCYLALANWNEAISIAEQQVRNHAQNPTLLGKLAYAYYMKRDYQNAALYYGRIVALYPWDMENRGYLLNNLYLAGRREEAQAQYLKLKKYYPASTIISEYRSIFE
jgi:tetratricopeptide (TPR) repeat protein